MEIGPVANVRIAPMVKSRETDLGLTDVYDIERSARLGDETYIPSSARAASGYEDDSEEDEDTPEEPEQESETEPKAQPAGKAPVDYFA